MRTAQALVGLTPEPLSPSRRGTALQPDSPKGTPRTPRQNWSIAKFTPLQRWEGSFDGYLKKSFSVTAAFQVTEDFVALTSSNLHTMGVVLKDRITHEHLRCHSLLELEARRPEA